MKVWISEADMHNVIYHDVKCYWGSVQVFHYLDIIVNLFVCETLDKEDKKQTQDRIEKGADMRKCGVDYETKPIMLQLLLLARH